MTYRIVRNDEPGVSGVGLIAVRASHKNPVPADSHLLITVRTEGRPFSYLVTPEDILVGVDAESYVRSVPQVKPISRIRRITAVVGYVAATVFVATLLLVGLTGTLAFRVVLTESMKPTINPGDVVVTLSDNVVTPQMNDVVVYVAKRFDGTPVAPFAHRIIGGDAETGWIVKGDNNPNADVQHPTADDISSVVVGVIPGVGKFFNVQVLTLIALLGVAVWLIVGGLRSRQES